MEEIPAKGVRGYLLYNPLKDRHYFRVYESEDKRQYTDYAVVAEDIKLEILSGGLSLYKSSGSNRLDWSSKVLSPKKVTAQGQCCKETNAQGVAPTLITSPEEDERHLSWLAGRFRDAGRLANCTVKREAIAKEYAVVLKRLLEKDILPYMEDQLPDEWMPKEFFEYLGLNRCPNSNVPQPTEVCPQDKAG